MTSKYNDNRNHVEELSDGSLYESENEADYDLDNEVQSAVRKTIPCKRSKTDVMARGNPLITGKTKNHYSKTTSDKFVKLESETDSNLPRDAYLLTSYYNHVFLIQSIIVDNTKARTQSVKDFIGNPCTKHLPMYSLVLMETDISPTVQSDSLRWWEVHNRIQHELYNGVGYDEWSTECLYAEYAHEKDVWYIGTSNKSFFDPYRPYCLSYSALKHIEEKITFIVIFRQVNKGYDCGYTYKTISFYEFPVDNWVTRLLEDAVDKLPCADPNPIPVARSALGTPRVQYKFSTPKAWGSSVLASPGARGSSVLTSPGARGSSVLASPGDRGGSVLASPGARGSSVLTSSGPRGSSVLASPGARGSSVQSSPGARGRLVGKKRPRLEYTEEQNDWLYEKLYVQAAGRVEGWDKVREQFLLLYPEVDISVQQLKDKEKNIKKTPTPPGTIW